MPVIHTDTKPEVERREPGSGGRGPVDKKPTGGGGESENWNNRPAGKRGPRELLGTYRLGLFLVLAGDWMFFAALALTFFLRRTEGHWEAALQSYVMDWHPIHIPEILWVNTGLLALSSLTMELARRRVFREPDTMEAWLGLGRPGRSKTLLWLGATMALGISFLTGQYFAWRELWAQSVFLQSGPSSQFFYLVTAAHGLHLALALAGLVVAGLIVALHGRLQTRQIAVDISGWYWHAMGTLWIFLFFLLKIAQ